MIMATKKIIDVDGDFDFSGEENDLVIKVKQEAFTGDIIGEYILRNNLVVKNEEYTGDFVGGSADDKIHIKSQYTGDLQTGDGNDKVFLKAAEGSVVTGDLGDGDDKLFVKASSSDLTMGLGSGDDKAWIKAYDSSVELELGEGNLVGNKVVFKGPGIKSYHDSY